MRESTVAELLILCSETSQPTLIVHPTAVSDVAALSWADLCAWLDAEDLHIMHQQPPRPHQDMHLTELEAAGPSTRAGLESPARTSRPGSIVGRLHPPSPNPDPPGGPHLSKLLPDTAAPKPSIHQQAAQQQRAVTETADMMMVAAMPQAAGHAASVVRFPQIEQTMAAPAVQQAAVVQSPQWSAVAHVNALDLLLQAAQAMPGNAQVALQHLQSIRMLCHACMGCVVGVEGMSRAAAPLQSMQCLCSLATAASLQQPHAQEAMWLSLRLLHGQVSDVLNVKV